MLDNNLRMYTITPMKYVGMLFGVEFASFGDN